MDNFNCLVIHQTGDDGGIELLCEKLQMYNEDDLTIDTAIMAWHDGGLSRLLGQRSDRHAPFYMRGAALFDNPDDAKNEYLMDPEPYVSDDTIAHVPWIMVIPNWATDFRRDPASPERYHLASVTVFVYWQEI